MTTTALIPEPSTDKRPEIIDIGPDGDWLIAYGHIDPALYVCLAFAHLAERDGMEGARHMLDGEPEWWVDLVCHRWAVQFQIDGAPAIRWGGPTGDVIEADEGAFPITMLNLEGFRA